MNLLKDRLLTALTDQGTETLSLPGLFAALGQDRVHALSGLQPHQKDIFHIFLCYLAGSVLARSGRSDPLQSEECWREGLRDLAGRSDDCAWETVVEDPTLPAFMQPPSPTKAVFDNDYRPKAFTPDSLDVLQTAKNHDLKAARISANEIEKWILALICTQTASGFLGQGNYGIVRMNGGFGSRVCFSWQSNRRPGSRFQRDTTVLLRYREKLLSPPYNYADRGLTLLWLEPWDGNSSLNLSSLDPFFIEVARRIRLVHQGRLLALGATSKTTRIAGQALKGNLGDPWTPVKTSTSSALSPSGLQPKLLRDLIFQDEYTLTPMQIPAVQDTDGWFCGSVLVRGQGTTDGFHEAAVRVPAPAKPFLFAKGVKSGRLAKLSRLGLEAAALVQNKCLRPSLYALMEGGPNDLDFGKREVSGWVDNQARSFLTAWQPHYFEWLWSTIASEDDTAALRPWVRKLRDLAFAVLEKAFKASPLRSGRKYRSISRASGIFLASFTKNLADYSEEWK